MEENSKYIESYYPILEKMYKEENKFIESFNLVHEIEEKIFNGEISSQFNNDESSDLSDYEIYKSNKMINQIYLDYDLYYRCNADLIELQNIQPERIENNIESWFKEYSINSLSTSGRTIINANIKKATALILENDIYPEKNIDFESSKVIEQISELKWLIKLSIKMPITFSNRQTIISGLGCKINDPKSFFIIFKSIEDSNRNENSIDDGFEHVYINFGFYHLKYLSENQTLITNCYNFDPKLTSIPWVIINNFIKDISYDTLLQLKRKSEMESNLYEERIKERNFLYNILD